MEKHVKDFLKSLGTTPDKIAKTLVEMKIKGERMEGNTCPIAKAIKKKFKFKNVSICYENIEFVYNKEICTVWLKAIGKFMDNFDDGKYPELETKNSLENDFPRITV